ncbi:hypothetical protein HYALB_00003991 [Hymenoscyphus albidus]|uniref:Uncharacterized protein n=1 Tax=Hymenoscyphus albidus TaxID=595503 RepID=A0A9N9LXK6_9HELO|nr:hypothetical protein HYALB_00003991 [Hymenoscyphus albidus]
MAPPRKLPCDCTSSKEIYFPRVSILQTCKLINAEATPIFYSINRFVVSLRNCSPAAPAYFPDLTGTALERPFLHKSLTSMPRKPNFQLSYFRWSTLAQIKSLSFISGNNSGFAEDVGERSYMGGTGLPPINAPPPTHDAGGGVNMDTTGVAPMNASPSTNDTAANTNPDTSTNEPATRPDGSYLRPHPSFECTGLDILARFSVSDRQYSPGGPDDYMALSLSNWVSMKVMRAELNAFQKELEVMMRTVPLPAHAVPPMLPLPTSIQPIHTSLMMEMDFLAGVNPDVRELGHPTAAGPNHPPHGNTWDAGEQEATRDDDVD